MKPSDSQGLKLGEINLFMAGRKTGKSQMTKALFDKLLAEFEAEKENALNKLKAEWNVHPEFKLLRTLVVRICRGQMK